MAIELTPDERETHLNMTGDNHEEWEVSTDDPFWQRRFEKLGIVPIAKTGPSCCYRLRADQVLIRKGKPQVSEQTRQARVAHMKNLHRAGSVEA